VRRDAAGDGVQLLHTIERYRATTAAGPHSDVTLFSPAAAQAMTLAGINAPMRPRYGTPPNMRALLRFESET
jgi:hypothetical protein